MKVKTNYQIFKLETGRVIFPIVLSAVVASILFYVRLSSEMNGLQLFLYKVGLANAGFLNAHIVRKFAFPKIDWEDNKCMMLKILIIVLYVVFIYCYTVGG